MWEGLCKENTENHLVQTVRREGLSFPEAESGSICGKSYCGWFSIIWKWRAVP